ncbi:hypothetical protein DICPUDRAFT_150921 [Dictyostelium purpureum]|uniref:Uncharacterized protein n=1 Tax=Dictyostelium purpureum TaxID=5786 RepID=F0ZHK7_DICPU|nr:uncharacterized protein DICPUDRAFT_150921 [Dictyostelium purpureum]EGC36598.1 hypothetical protein DICPUDRAFT_150921 [Dictyostelium purpureum]|eukprot:XP_003286902.1 hypothetical protein DICPUDRAFT_150921 [Dictyostelium purpureum]
MVWRKLPKVVLKQRQSIGTYRQSLQNQIRLFSTISNNGENNNNNDNKEGEDDNNLLNMALSMQKIKKNVNIKNDNDNSNNNNNNSNVEATQDSVSLETYDEASDPARIYLEQRIHENGDLKTDDGELTDLSYYDASDRITMAHTTTTNKEYNGKVSKNEKAVRIEFIKAFQHYNPRPSEAEDITDDNEVTQVQELEQMEDQGEALPYEIKYPLKDSTRTDILIKFIQNYKANGEQLYRQYISLEQVGNFGLLKKDYSDEFPPYVDRVNGNIMVYDPKFSAYKYYSNIYQDETQRFSKEQILRSRFFNDDLVIISKYLKSSPSTIRNAIIKDQKLFEQVLRLIRIDQQSNALIQNAPELDPSKQSTIIAKIAQETGLLPNEIANNINSTRDPEYQLMDNPSYFIKKAKAKQESFSGPLERSFNKDAQDTKNDEILQQYNINMAPKDIFSFDNIRDQYLRDQLSQYYLEVNKREIPKQSKKQQEQQEQYKPIPAGYEKYDAPIEDVLPSKPSSIDNFNPDFYKDFIQYRVLAMPHENLRMQEVLDAYKDGEDFQDLVINDGRIKRDEVRFFMENYLNKDFEVDFDKVQNDMESLYYKQIITGNKTTTNKPSSSSSSPELQQSKTEGLIDSSIVSSVLNISEHFNIKPSSESGSASASAESDKIGNIELNDQENSPLSEEYTIESDLNNPSEQDDTNIDAELFLDSDETLTLDSEEFKETEYTHSQEQDYEGEEEEGVDFSEDHEVEEHKENSKDTSIKVHQNIEDYEYEGVSGYYDENSVFHEYNDEEGRFVLRDESGEICGYEEGEYDDESYESYEEEPTEVTHPTDMDESEVPQSFREEGKGNAIMANDLNDPFFNEELANAGVGEGEEHEELPQYLEDGDELFVKDMEQYTDSLFLTIETEENTITFGELDDDELTFSGENNNAFSEEDNQLVPFEVDFGKIQESIEAKRSQLSKEDLLQSVQEDFGNNYYDGLVQDKILEKIKARLSPEAYNSLIEILETPESEETQELEQSSEEDAKVEQILQEIRSLSGNKTASFDDIDVEEESESIDEYSELEYPEDYDHEDDRGLGFRFDENENEEEENADLIHPEGIQQFEDAVEEMELFELMEGTYEEDLDLLRAEADMYVKRNEKKMKVLAKRRAFAKQMRDKQLEQNKLNPPVKAPYVIPVLPTGKNIYTSVLAPPNSYLKLQTIRNQPQNKEAHKEIIQESYRALSSNAFYGVKEAEFAVKKIHRELGNAEGYKRYRQHSKKTTKPVPSPILSKPDLIVETEKLNDFNPLYRNN